MSNWTGLYFANPVIKINGEFSLIVVSYSWSVWGIFSHTIC